jgi:CRP-like cAMP-binding protein
LELVQLSLKDVIYERGMPIQYVYFPVSCTLSVLAFMRTGAAVEVATIGNEGFSGVDLMIGADVASNTYVCQIAGDSVRMRASDFKEIINVNATLRNVTQCFLQAYVSQITQSVACNRLHTVEERFARWLLIMHDRATGDSFYLTQEFMADMLGVHRPTVSLVAAAYQQAGMIRYLRGHMTILNRAELEDASCECYGAVAKNFLRLLGIRRG